MDAWELFNKVEEICESHREVVTVHCRTYIDGKEKITPLSYERVNCEECVIAQILNYENGEGFKDGCLNNIKMWRKILEEVEE